MRKLTLFLLLVLAIPGTAAALDTEDVLAMVAMPLAVAAVADLAEVPTSDLISVVTALNQADVPPVQFVEVVRYVPVVLVDDDIRPEFVTFVTAQVSQGVIGQPLAVAIADRLRLVGVQEINVVSPAPVVVTEQILPPIVVTRVAEVRAHPHGGPPGQLKKQLGLQTGAEVVHGTKPGRDDRPMTSIRVDDDDDRGRGKGKKDNVRLQGPGNDARVPVQVIEQGSRGRGNADQVRGGSSGPGKGKGQGKGKGKGDR